MARKVSDEFTVPLCRGHHREVHRTGDEAAWWRNTRIDPTVVAGSLWLKSHPVPPDFAGSRSKSAVGKPVGVGDQSHTRAGSNYKTKPIISASSQ